MDGEDIGDLDVGQGGDSRASWWEETKEGADVREVQAEAAVGGE